MIDFERLEQALAEAKPFGTKLADQSGLAVLYANARELIDAAKDVAEVDGRRLLFMEVVDERDELRAEVRRLRLDNNKLRDRITFLLGVD